MVYIKRKLHNTLLYLLVNTVSTVTRAFVINSNNSEYKSSAFQFITSEILRIPNYSKDL